MDVCSDLMSTGEGKLQVLFLVVAWFQGGMASGSTAYSALGDDQVRASSPCGVLEWNLWASFYPSN